MTGPFEVPAAPDPRLDPYRRAIARVHDGDRLIGHLATRVQTWWTVTGPFWRRRYVRPTEVLEWLLRYSDPELDVVEDAVSVVALDEELHDWGEGRFGLTGEPLRLEWLHGPEATQAWRRNGWDSP